MSLPKWLNSTPLLARVAPFVIFVLLTSLQGVLGEVSKYWVYALKTILGAWMVWIVRKSVIEAQWTFSLRAFGVGLLVFLVWVGLDPLYAKTASSPTNPWNPFLYFKDSEASAWVIVIIRIVGSTVIVPPLEEAFYRSFLYRYIQNQAFANIDLKRFELRAFLITSCIFGAAHSEWLAGILCGLAYQWLVIRRGNLGEAMTAHATTNFLLGIWVVTRNAWNFW